MINHSMKDKGFTLVELMLSMAFIAFLLLFLVAAILQVTRLYVKGSAIRQINQTSRQLLEDVAASIRTGGTPSVTSTNRLCAGNTSYAWNVYGETVYNTFSDSTDPIRFISVQDPDQELCDNPNSSISKLGSVDLIGMEVTTRLFTVERQGKITKIRLVLSTSGDNVAKPASTPSGFACDPNNQFCAFGDFATSVYSMGGS